MRCRCKHEQSNQKLQQGQSRDPEGAPAGRPDPAARAQRDAIEGNDVTLPAETLQLISIDNSLAKLEACFDDLDYSLAASFKRIARRNAALLRAIESLRPEGSVLVLWREGRHVWRRRLEGGRPPCGLDDRARHHRLDMTEPRFLSTAEVR